MTLPPLYPILDTASLVSRGIAPAEAARAMLDGGARILQFRHKGHFSRGVFAQAEQVAAICQARGALFVIDDRADIARLLDAGLHVGQDDLPPALARRVLGDKRVLGFSTHNAGQLRAAAADPVDYLALGPVFATASKENPDAVIGAEGVRQWRGLASRPLVAIGGITRQNALAVLEAGADSLAVIGGLLPEPCTPASIRQRTEEWTRLLERRRQG